MRLGTCIVLELAVTAGAVGGAWVGVGHAIHVATDYIDSNVAAAATTAPAIAPLPAARLRVAARLETGTVYDAPDDVLLAPLGATPVAHVKLNHGGTSLSLRLDFASGARAAFKPEQIHPQSDPRREIAAFRIDRLLGIGHVPPARPYTVAVDDLVAAADPAYRTYTAGRIADEAIAHGGVVHGELSWWIPEIRDLTFGKHRADEPEGMADWASYLQAGADMPQELQPLLAQLAACVLFDVVIDNADRWTGNNTKSSVDRKTLYFMDNTLAFSIYTYGHEANLTPLRRISVFPRGLVARLRALTLETVTRALDVGDDPLAPLLAPDEIRGILARRDHVMQYIDGLIEQYGEDKVLALP